MTAPSGAWSKQACCILSLIILATSPIFAATPAVGDRAPDFQLLNMEGKTLRLFELTARGQVVLVVLRGYPGYQCPYCNRQVQDFLQKAPAFDAAGVHVVMVYVGT
jgi:peroxiredoxin